MFEGTFKGVEDDCDIQSCNMFSAFISEAILKRVKMGAVKLYGKVNRDKSPFWFFH